MANNDDPSEPMFVIRPTDDGKRWRVYAEGVYTEPIEIDTFFSETAARYWIETVSQSWLEKRKRYRSI